MKSYSMHDSTSPAQKADAELVAKHKKEREGTNRKVNSIEATANDTLDDFDDIIVDDPKTNAESQDLTIVDEDGDGYGDYIVDSKGERIEIKDAMWESKGKRTKYQEKTTVPSWQKRAVQMSVKDWLTFLICCLIPGINIGLLVYHGYFSSTTPDEKRNYCRANVILIFLFVLAITIMAFTMDGFRLKLLNVLHSFI